MTVSMILRKRKMTFKSKWWIIQLSIIAVLIFLLYACASTPTAKDLANADYGPYPDNYMQSIKNYGKGFFKDPQSARWNFNYLPREMWLGYWGGVRYGYGVCTEINTKDSLGVYSGFKTHFFLIKNGLVVQHVYDSGKKKDWAFLKNRCGGN